MRAMRTLLAIVALLAVSACATSAGPGVGGDPIDADPNAPDADPNAPDADPNAPDADPGAPDAEPSSSCATSPCDLIDQCGCAGGQACDVDFTDLMGTACRGVATPGDQNDTCAAINQCGAGFACVGAGSCEQYCDADADCGTPRGKCVIQLVDNQTPAQPIAGAVVCSSNCDPAAATNATCPTAWTCDMFTATFNAVDHDIADCRAAGTRTQGQSCSAAMTCVAQHTCVNSGGSPVCGKICKRPAGTECTGGTTCFGYTEPLMIGTQEYGVCL
jgi:hypothetical protein